MAVNHLKGGKAVQIIEIRGPNLQTLVLKIGNVKLLPAAGSIKSKLFMFLSTKEIRKLDKRVNLCIEVEHS